MLDCLISVYNCIKKQQQKKGQEGDRIPEPGASFCTLGTFVNI